MDKRCALITGITGQDGIYLAELLLQKGYVVHGIVRRIAYRPKTRLEHLFDQYPNQLTLHTGDVTDSLAMTRIISLVRPQEIYHLAAQSDVELSFQQPLITGQITGLGTMQLLEIVRILELAEETRIYQASSSELFGKVQEVPQSEKTPFYPRSPYAVAKLYAYWAAINYREAYGMFVSNGILFNHESPLRGSNFVTQKIAQGIARYIHGSTQPLLLGNLNAKRDWGYAPEYVWAMWRMLQHDKADDYVIATGRTQTVRQFVELVCAAGDITIIWEGFGLEERGVDSVTGNTIVMVSPLYFRPTEVDLLCGDPRKAERELHWQALVSIEEIAKIMLRAALADDIYSQNKIDNNKFVQRKELS